MKKSLLKYVTGLVALVLLFMVWVYPEVTSGIYAVAGLLFILVMAMLVLNQQQLKAALYDRSVRYGTNAVLTIGLVVAILVVINFMNFNHFIRKDLTKNHQHSLSEQSIKLMQNAEKSKTEIKFTVFVKSGEREPIKAVLDNYAYHSKHVVIEYVDPDRDPTRAKAVNVKKYGTVILKAGQKETRIEEVTEEKITNALIKVLNDKTVTICFMTGHGERTPDQEDPESYSSVKKELSSQNYQTKTFNLLEEGKIPDVCSVVLDLGPNKAFFDKEIKVLSDWLDAGGRALFAIDPNMKGIESEKEIKKLLADWSFEIQHNLVLDPTSRLLGVNASVPIVGMYSKEHPVTKDFQVTTLFPLSSVADVKAVIPASLKSWWMAKSTQKAFAKSDFKEIATGQVKLDERKDLPGPHTLMAAVEGSRPSIEVKKPIRPTRIVVMGTSQMASNRWAGHGANLDLFLNTVSWLADDENLISIRAKDEGAEVPTLTQTEGRYIQLVTMILLPGLMLFLGVFVWLRRRKL